jgi:hypothetical protein
VAVNGKTPVRASNAIHGQAHRVRLTGSLVHVRPRRLVDDLDLV